MVPRPAMVSASPAAAKRRAAASSVAPIATAIGAPCVLASLAFRSPGTRNNHWTGHSNGTAVPHRRHAADDGAARRDARVRARDGRRGDGHDLARRGVSVVAQARDGSALVHRCRRAHGARDDAPHDRLGHHRRLDAPPRSGGDGRASRAGSGRPGTVHPRLRDVEDLPQQHEDADDEDARPDARRGHDRARRPRRRALRVRR